MDKNQLSPVFSLTSRITESTTDSPYSICPPGKVIPGQFGFTLFCTSTRPFPSHIIHIFVSITFSIYSFYCRYFKTNARYSTLSSTGRVPSMIIFLFLKQFIKSGLAVCFARVFKAVFQTHIIRQIIKQIDDKQQIAFAFNITVRSNERIIIICKHFV